jgi:hypothetical protein
VTPGLYCQFHSEYHGKKVTMIYQVGKILVLTRLVLVGVSCFIVVVKIDEGNHALKLINIKFVKVGRGINCQIN